LKKFIIESSLISKNIKTGVVDKSTKVIYNIKGGETPLTVHILNGTEDVTVDHIAENPNIRHVRKYIVIDIWSEKFQIEPPTVYQMTTEQVRKLSDIDKATVPAVMLVDGNAIRGKYIHLIDLYENIVYIKKHMELDKESIFRDVPQL